MIINHLHWETRTHYFELIEQFLNGLIHFLDLRNKYHFIEDLISLFDKYCPDPTIRKNYEFSAEKLKNLIQKILIKMKDHYP
jgi:oligoendopeptidase F